MKKPKDKEVECYECGAVITKNQNFCSQCGYSLLSRPAQKSSEHPNLVSCRECGGNVSKRASNCPHCGIKRSNDRGEETLSRISLEIETAEKELSDIKDLVGGRKKKKPLGTGSFTGWVGFLAICLLGFVLANLDEPKKKQSNPTNISKNPQKKQSKSVSSKKAAIKKTWRDEDNRLLAYSMTEDFVARQLKSPSTADFPGIWDGQRDHVTDLGGQKYRIASYVDSQNVFGATLRTKFWAEITQTSEGTWKLISLEME